MVTINIAEKLDDDGEEVLLELCTDNVKLYAFCYPFSEQYLKKWNKVTLYSLFAHNVRQSLTLLPPKRTFVPYFGHQIWAEVIDPIKNLVRLGDIDIILHLPRNTNLDNFSIGSIISFDVVRLDFAGQGQTNY